MDNRKLLAIVRDSINVYNEKKNMRCVVTKSIPLAWLGDVEAYFASSTRIVALMAAPSPHEVEGDRFEAVDMTSPKDAARAIFDNLNGYFSKYPNMEYFKHFDVALGAVGGSFTDERKDVALAVPIYTPLVCNATWGQLSENSRKRLADPTLFKQLLNELDPDVILFSLNSQTQKELFGDWEPLSAVEIGELGFVNAYGKDGRLLLCGRNYFGTPFGAMDAQEVKKQLSKALRSFKRKLQSKA